VRPSRLALDGKSPRPVTSGLTSSVLTLLTSLLQSHTSGKCSCFLRLVLTALLFFSSRSFAFSLSCSPLTLSLSHWQFILSVTQERCGGDGGHVRSSFFKSGPLSAIRYTGAHPAIRRQTGNSRMPRVHAGGATRAINRKASGLPTYIVGRPELSLSHVTRGSVGRHIFCLAGGDTKELEDSKARKRRMTPPGLEQRSQWQL
jgi:hypothetical protein